LFKKDQMKQLRVAEVVGADAVAVTKCPQHSNYSPLYKNPPGSDLLGYLILYPRR
jgi:hypothetical protein